MEDSHGNLERFDTKYFGVMRLYRFAFFPQLLDAHSDHFLDIIQSFFQRFPLRMAIWKGGNISDKKAILVLLDNDLKAVCIHLHTFFMDS